MRNCHAGITDFAVFLGKKPTLTHFGQYHIFPPHRWPGRRIGESFAICTSGHQQATEFSQNSPVDGSASGVAAARAESILRTSEAQRQHGCEPLASRTSPAIVAGNWAARSAVAGQINLVQLRFPPRRRNRFVPQATRDNQPVDRPIAPGKGSSPSPPWDLAFPGVFSCASGNLFLAYKKQQGRQAFRQAASSSRIAILTQLHCFGCDRGYYLGASSPIGFVSPPSGVVLGVVLGVLAGVAGFLSPQPQTLMNMAAQTAAELVNATKRLNMGIYLLKSGARAGPRGRSLLLPVETVIRQLRASINLPPRPSTHPGGVCFTAQPSERSAYMLPHKRCVRLSRSQPAEAQKPEQ